MAAWPHDGLQHSKDPNFAAAQGNDAAREARDLVAENMTIAEIAEAQRRALEWQPMPES